MTTIDLESMARSLAQRDAYSKEDGYKLILAALRSVSDAERRRFIDIVLNEGERYQLQNGRFRDNEDYAANSACERILDALDRDDGEKR